MGILHDLFHRREEVKPPERRQSTRYLVEEPSELYVTDRPLSATLVDVSIHGARIATRFPRDTGEVIGVQIQLDGIPMILPLRLLWRRMVDGSYQFGGLFVDLTAEEQHYLGRYIHCAVQRRRALQKTCIA